jgi:hypothetical protein
MRLPIPEGYRDLPATPGEAGGDPCAGRLTVACSGDSVRKRRCRDLPEYRKGGNGKADFGKNTTEYVATLKSGDSAVIMPQVEGQITAIYAFRHPRLPGNFLDAD